MADFKVVFRSDGNTTGEHRLLWSPGCPVLLTAVQVSRNTQTSAAFLQVKVRNVSGDLVKSVAYRANVSYFDETRDVIEFEDMDFDLVPSGEKPLKAQALPRGDVEAADVTVTFVLTDCEKWKATEEPVDVPRPSPLALGERAMAERCRILTERGVDKRAHNRAVIDNGDWWVCACGQLNVGRHKCCRCGSTKEVLLGNEGETELLASADERDDSIYNEAVGFSRNADDVDALSRAADLFGQIPSWKDASKRMADCQESAADLRRKNADRKKRAAIKISVIVAVAMLLLVFVVVPFARYAVALNQIETGQCEEAITALQDLGDYLDSKNRLVEAKYRYTLSHKRNNDERTYTYLTELKEAGYKDSASLYSELFEWHFEFAYDGVSHYDERNKKVFWPEGEMKKEADSQGRTTVYCFSRATGVPWGGTRRLKIEKQVIENGSPKDWKVLKTRGLNYCTYSAGGGIVQSPLNLIWPGHSGGDVGDGCRVRVTDYDTGEMIYEGEAIQP